jgi:rhamnosyltransferase
MEASVVINARNEEANIAACLDAVLGQKIDGNFEVIVVDSGSSDRTVEIASSYPVRLKQTPPEEFRWGRNRNIGAELGTGTFIAYLSADAAPANDRWLAELLQGFEGPQVAGTYGRQVARPWAYPMEKFYMHYTYPPKRRVQSWSGGDITMDETWFSNVSAAIRREVWEQHPFSDTVLFGEDQEWSLRVLRAGYRISYEPDSVVYHSHNYSLKKALMRSFNSGVSSFESYMPESKPRPFYFLGRGLRYWGSEVAYLATHRYPHWIPFAALYEMTKFAGLILGRYHERLPKPITRRLIWQY